MKSALRVVHSNSQSELATLGRRAGPHGDNSKSDVVGPPLGFEAEAEGRSAGPAWVGPAAAAAHSGDGAIAIHLRRAFGGIFTGTNRRAG